jgi:hypothetical protein
MASPGLFAASELVNCRRAVLHRCYCRVHYGLLRNCGSGHSCPLPRHAFESRILYRQPGSILREPKDKDDPEYWNVSTPVLTMWVALLMTAGEVAALLGLYHDIEHPIINALIWYGLVAGLAGIFWPVWSYQLQLYKRIVAAAGSSRVILALVLSMLLAICLVVNGFIIF